MAASSSRLNPAAPPFVSVVISHTNLCSTPPLALPMGCLRPPPPPPPFSFGGVLATVSNACAVLATVSNACAVGAFVLPPLPWLHVPPPAPVFCSPPSCPVPVPVNASPVPAYCAPPPLPATRCTIKEVSDDGSGSDKSPKTAVEGEPSPRSVLTPWSRPQPASTKPRVALPAPSRVVVGSKPIIDRSRRLPAPSPVESSKPAFDPHSVKTSLMICNIPNSFMKRTLMDILDKHCAEENEKLARCSRRRLVLKSEYDFLYLPIDFKTRFNKGYAFINMTTAAAARRLHAFLHGHSWAAWGSGKVCEVVHSDIQGLDAFVAHFSGSKFPCGDGKREFLPVRFGPARDGTRPTAERIIGCAVRPDTPRWH